MYLVHLIKPPILKLQKLRFGDFFNILDSNKQTIFQEKNQENRRKICINGHR